MDRERAGFDAWCAAVSPRLVGVLQIRGSNSADAYELVQDALSKAWEHSSELALMDHPDRWLYRVAINKSISRWRKRSAEARALNRHGPVPDSAAEPDRETAAVVRDAVAGLPERQRLAIALRYFADLTIEDAAEVMGCAPGTIKSLTNQAVTNLRAKLGQDLAEFNHA